MKVDLATKEDIERVRELLEEVKDLLQSSSNSNLPKYIRSKELRVCLGGMSDTALSNLRNRKIIPYLKLEGTYLYEVTEVMNALKNHQVGTSHSTPRVEFREFSSPPAPLLLKKVR